MRALALLLLAPVLLAARLPDHQRYEDCTALVRQNAAAAFSEGLDWVDKGGGVAARHCSALALSAMGKHEAAAELMLEAANAAADGKGVQLLGMEMTPQLRAQLYAQAGHSFILADKPSAAIAPFSDALEHLPIASPAAADVMADRARALAMSGNLEGAFADLTVAVGIMPDDPDILLLRASAARQTDRLTIARQDVARLADLRPDMPALWMEKAKIAMADDEPTPARKHLQRAIELDDGGPVTQAARYLLEELMLRPGR
ncbi:MAG: hypothetical protein AAF221_03950 [Pseudomonadota bacterium]